MSAEVKLIKSQRFAHELYEIGRLSSPEEKSRRLQGRYDLAVNALSVWHSMQLDLRQIDEVASLDDLIQGELEEVGEKEQLELDLLLNDQSAKYLPWYQRERALDYWAVANEMADVMVLVVSKMITDGMNEEEILQALIGRVAPIMNKMIARTAVLGMDLAEIMILKTEINMQHRDPSLLAWVRGDGFMKMIRQSIGNQDSQIPHLAQGFLGTTVLTELQTPAYSEEQVRLNRWWMMQLTTGGAGLPSLVDDGMFGNLYRWGVRWWLV